jgi:hypothetical protein
MRLPHDINYASTCIIMIWLVCHSGASRPCRKQQHSAAQANVLVLMPATTAAGAATQALQRHRLFEAPVQVQPAWQTTKEATAQPTSVSVKHPTRLQQPPSSTSVHPLFCASPSSAAPAARVSNDFATCRQLKSKTVNHSDTKTTRQQSSSLPQRNTSAMPGQQHVNCRRQQSTTNS